MAAHRPLARGPVRLIGPSALHVDSAVDVDLLPSNVVTVADEEGSSLRYFLRQSKAVHWDLLLDLFAASYGNDFCSEPDSTVAITL